MLEKIFCSKIRVKLLRFFLTNDLEFYYLAEICKKTGLNLSTVKKEMENLKKLDLINEGKTKIATQIFPEKDKKIKSGKKSSHHKSEKENFKVFYTLNKNFILYPELKSLLIKSQLLLEEFLVKRIKKLGKVYFLALSGFFTGVASKTDLLIVGRINKKRIKNLINDLEKDLGRDINYTVMSLQEYKFRGDLTDRFLFDVLENKKVVLIDEL